MQWLISLCLYKISNVLLSKNLYSAFSFGNVFNGDRIHSEERLLFSSLTQKSPADTEMKTCLFSVLYVCFRSKMVILCSRHDVKTCRVLKTRAAVLSLHYGCRIGASVNKLTLHQSLSQKKLWLPLSQVNVWVTLRFASVVLNSVFQVLLSIIHSAQLLLIPAFFSIFFQRIFIFSFWIDCLETQVLKSNLRCL